MSRETYASTRRARMFGGASVEARAQRLAETYDLETLEEMAVTVVDAARKEELDLAVRIGREARGGSSHSGGAVHDPGADAGVDGQRTAGGRIVLDGSIEPPTLGEPLLRPDERSDRSGGFLAALRERLT